MLVRRRRRVSYPDRYAVMRLDGSAPTWGVFSPGVRRSRGGSTADQLCTSWWQAMLWAASRARRYPH